MTPELVKPHNLFLFILIGCGRIEQPQEDVVQKDEGINVAIKSYVLKEFYPDSVRVGDSIRIMSLGATLYHVRYENVLDGPTYTLIRDHHTDNIYKMILPGWPAGMDPHCDIQLSTLEDNGKTEPVDYFFLGLEAFLNQSAAIKRNGLPMAALDSILVFWWPFMKQKITDPKVIEDFLNYTLKDPEAHAKMSKKWVDKMTGLLKEKLKNENV